uniref:Uncharacterized protein n=1 Tax=Meloidogyne enterolobii TaxID=390850 RepID=A0A6V7XP09_MELEN|nr:unnamed protein product [Meloidogyne enterolobii]
MLSSFKIIVLFSLNLLIKIEADDPCENPCVNFCLKPECKGLYNNNKKLAFHLSNNLYATNDDDYLRNYLAVEIIIWHRTMNKSFLRGWNKNEKVKKLRKWTVNLWKKWGDRFDAPYCLINFSGTDFLALEKIKEKFPAFIYRIVNSIEDLKSKDNANKYTNNELGDFLFVDDLQVLMKT